MTLLNSMGLISTIAILVPIISILALKLAWYKSFPALLLYYLFLLSYNLVNLAYINVGNPAILNYHKIVNHLVETPLILSFFTYFSRTVEFRKKLLLSIAVYVGFEITMIGLYGFTPRAITYIMAPGLLIILALSSMFFLHQVKIAVIYHKAVGKAIIIASLLFAYSGYSFVYVVDYVIETQYTMDVYLIYYLITIITSIPVAIGIYFERKRIRHLSELQTTREELKKIYGEEVPEDAENFGKVALNYDKEQWN
jgi:hypothetical protein